MARGKSRQEARGHRIGEHARRSDREREEEGLSGDEARAIRSWTRRRAETIHDRTSDPEDFVQFFKENGGYEGFLQYKYVWTRTRTKYVNVMNSSPAEYTSYGRKRKSIGESLEALADEAGVDDLSWLYYH